VVPPSSGPAASQWRRVQQRWEWEATGAEEGINNDSGGGCEQHDKNEKTRSSAAGEVLVVLHGGGEKGTTSVALA
jgi:hypothetical protein